MSIQREEVRRIATLANFELTEAEEKRLAAELSVILDDIDQLREVEIAPASSEPGSAPTPLREDAVTPSLNPEAVAGNAPSFAHGHFVVPRVIGGE